MVPTLGRNYKNCLDSMEGDYKEVYVITDKENLTAFAVLQMAGSFRGYIQSVCVSPTARGKGFGTALLQLSLAPHIVVPIFLPWTLL